MRPEISFTYSFPYLIVLLILLLLFLKGNEYLNDLKKFANIRIATVVLLLIFIGLRGHIYSDWYSYFPYFRDLPTFWSGGVFKELYSANMEPGFTLYSILIKSIFPNYFVWVFINTAIDIWILDRVFSKHTKYYVLAFMAFFVFNGLIVEFNLYRNSKAIMLFILSLHYLNDRKFVPYVLINLLAVTFHYSALLFFPLYFIIGREIPRYIVFVVFIISNIVFVFHVKWISFILGDIVSLINIASISDKTNIYTESADQVVLSLGYIERLITFLVFTFYYKKLVEYNSMNRIFYNVFLVYLISILCFAEIQVFSERFSFLFICSYWFLYPNLLAVLAYKRSKCIYLCIFITFLLLRTASANKDMLTRYDNLLIGVDSYENRAYDFDQFGMFLESEK